MKPAVSSGSVPSVAVSPGKAWLIVVLLFFFMFINFADKVVIGLAAIPIMDELKLAPDQFGFVGSSFFILFAASAILVGFVVNRFPARWVLLVMATVWALTQFPMVGTVGFATLVACRVALGAGEGPAYPVALHAVYKWFPNERRALPSSIIAIGSSVGILFAAPGLTWVIKHYDWHMAFAVLGVVGLIWVLAWLLLGAEGPIGDAEHPAAAAAGDRAQRVPYLRLLSSGTMLGCFIAGFVAYWGLAMMLVWGNAFLIQAQHRDPQDAAWVTGVLWTCGGLIVPTFSYISQAMLHRGGTSRKCRGWLTSGCVIAGGAGIVIMSLLPPGPLQLVFLVIGFGLPSVIFSLGPTMAGEITPLRQRGAVLAINTAVSTLGGLVSPAVMGKLVQAGPTIELGYRNGFVLAGIVSLVGGVIALVLINPEADRARFAAAGKAGPLAAAAAGSD